jgi:hypothetical protein
VTHVVESVAVAAPRGLVWRVVREIVTTDIEPLVVQDTRELTWTTTDRVEMQWRIRLAPGWTGTEVEHGCAFPDHAELIAPVRARVIATLKDVKARAEAQ